jgi:eukaryotic-like serine/threonine-protein kinase
MASNRWESIKELFEEVLERAPSERATLLAQICRDDEDLGAEVKRLILQYESAGDFLESPPFRNHAAEQRQGGVGTGLGPGTRLGPYEIQALAGSGGMADVYRARDTRLGRQVAIKVIGAAVEGHPDIERRFDHEVRLAASLDHPGICSIYDVGEHEGIRYFVMEYLEGEPLAARIAKKPLTIQQLLDYAIQIASALAYAHRNHILHRDVKPSNVFLTPSGVKVVDFGLAKIRRPHGERAPDSSTANTYALPLTRSGFVCGTPEYMAPEQLEGQPSDHRSDIFAFGVVLYEMATGHRPFVAPTSGALNAPISTKPAELDRDGTTTPELEWIIQRCLKRNPDDRWESMADLEAVLRRLAADVDVHSKGLFARALTGTVDRTNGSISKRRITAAGCAVATGIAAILMYVFWRTSEPTAAPVRFNVSLPANVALARGAVEGPAAEVALSLDGTAVAFLAEPAGGRRLIWIRRLSDVDARPVAGTVAALHPFWSPTGSHIGYFADGHLMRVDLAGGRPQVLADAPAGSGASWSRAGDIIFSPDGRGPLYRVHETGGACTQITSVDGRQRESGHRWPEFLPDGRHFLFFTDSDDRDIRGIYEGSLDTNEHKLVIASSFHGVYAEPGYLLFARDGDLVAQRFQQNTGELSGAMSTLIRNVGGASHGHGSYSASATALVYATPFDPERELVWFARSGARLERADGPADYVDFRASLNGRIAVARNRPDLRTSDIFIIDPKRNREHRLTSHPALDASPVWSPDSTRLVFRSKRRGNDIDGVNDLYEIAEEGLGTERLLLHTPAPKYPTDWAPDGSAILYHTESTDTGWDVWILPLGEDPTPRPLIATKANERQARISPDGRYIAYSSDASGRPEVYVRTYPPDSREWQVSTGGGTQPEWTRTGRELLFMTLDGTLSSASVAYTPQFRINRIRAELALPAPGLSAPFSPVYAISSDEKKVLVNVPKGLAFGPSMEVMLNWRALFMTDSQ